MKRGYAIAGFIASLVLIGWLVRGVEWHQVRLAFAQVRLAWIGVIAALVVLRLGIHAWRWTYLLRPVHPLGLGLCFRATGVGFLSNMVLPTQAGAVVRAMVAGAGGRVPVGSVLATVVLERLIGTLLLLPLMVLALGWADPPLLEPAMKASLHLALGFSIAGVLVVGLVLWGLVRAHDRTQAFLKRVLAFLPLRWVQKIDGWTEAFVSALRAMPTGRALAPFIALSVAMWGCWFAGNLCLFWAFDLALPLSAVLLLMLLQYLSFSLPAGPGVLGTYHVVATTGGLLLYGLPNAQAFSAAVVLRLTLSATVILVGLGCLVAEAVLAGRPARLLALARAEVAPGPEGA